MSCKSKKLNNSGQAVMEYILVLTVLVFVFLILLQMNKQFRKWGEDYFIAYYRCLLETGELPSLGGKSDVGGICSQQFQPFTLKAGWQPYPGGANGGNNSSGNSHQGGNSGGNAANNSSSHKASESSSGGTRGAEVSRVAGNGGQGQGRIGRFKDNKTSNGDSAGAVTNRKKSNYTGSNETTSFASKSGQQSEGGKDQGLNYGYGIQRNEQDRGIESTKISSKKSEAEKQQSKRFKIIKKVIPKTTNLEDDEFTLGSFFRLLIIAAIIIALGVLIGGQLLQIS
ncbi:MAG: hypothetical protein KDD40_06260, partial [Bdellovibrionales bacterium]|nr:hypothetical protein [Bdellovibrionales bacterium]